VLPLPLHYCNYATTTTNQLTHLPLSLFLRYLPGEKFAFAQTFGDLSSPLRLHHGVPATARAAAHDLPMQAKKRNLYEPTVYARSGGGGPCTSQSFSSWQSAELLHHKEWGDYKRGL